jgi:bacterioferritin
MVGRFGRHHRKGPAEMKLAAFESSTKATTPPAPASADYALGGKAVCALLNESLATELARFLRYKRQYQGVNGVQGQDVATQLQEHSGELAHAGKLAERIRHLGGTPDFNPGGLAGSAQPECRDGLSPKDGIWEDLRAERDAIEGYRTLIRIPREDRLCTRPALAPIPSCAPACQ